MPDKDKIIAEINRRLDAQVPLNYTEKDHIESNVYYSLLKYIKELPKEPSSEDLEAAAENHALQCHSKKASVATLAASIYDFRAGANWQREQMMKNSVQGVVTLDYWDAEDREVDVILADNIVAEEYGIKDGDKVKLIIIKED